MRGRPNTAPGLADFRSSSRRRKAEFTKPMKNNTMRIALLAAALAALAGTARAADPAPPPVDQVVVPQVDRRVIHLPRFPSSDFEIGTFVGTYSTQNFGSSAVGGIRLGYHITEDFFVEG